MAWSDEAIDRLKSMWAEGKTALEIGKALKMSRNAVLGKAHRLELQARMNPVETTAQKFERMVDMIADFDAPVDVAAGQVGLDRWTATGLWQQLCARMGPQAR